MVNFFYKFILLTILLIFIILNLASCDFDEDSDDFERLFVLDWDLKDENLPAPPCPPQNGGNNPPQPRTDRINRRIWRK